ncbi:MAG TPA: hypothetical protein VH590_14775 [Ktedonobacterales bacterium]
MSDDLPVALLHLREAEIVRLCGLARAARGQEYARTGQVRQAERLAGRLRAVVLEGKAARIAQARFSDSGLDAWECACSPPSPDGAAASSARTPCEHVAALLALWVREPAQFQVADSPAADISSSRNLAADKPSSAPLETRERLSFSDETERPREAALSGHKDAPELALASLEHLDQGLRRFLNLLALAGGSVTESEAQRLFARLDLGEPEAALVALEYLRQHGLAQPVFAAAAPARRAAAADRPAGWSIPEVVLAQLPRILPLTPLQTTDSEETQLSESGLREQRAEAGLPALLVLVAAQMVARGGPASGADVSQKPASRSTLDLDAALAQQWATPLKTTPEQTRFCLALLRLLGVLPLTSPPRAPSPGQAAALVRSAMSSEQARETLLRAYRLLLARPQVEVARDLFTHWLHTASARELVELRDAGVRVAWLSQRETRRAPDISAENQAARRFIVDLLRYVPTGRWWSFSSLVEFVWRFQPAFLRGRQQTFLRPQWWLERLPDGQPLAVDVRADWRQAEGRYIALLLRRALHWLGVVDLALDEQGRLKGFRVTPAGALLLGASIAPSDALVSAVETSASAASLPGTLQLQDDGTLQALLDTLRVEQLETLLWWCEPAGAAAGALRFRPGAAQVAAALDARQDLDAWLAWLEQQPRSAALTALVVRVRQWAALYGQVRLYESATVLEVADQMLLQELEVTLGLSEGYVDHTLAPGLAVLRPAAIETLVEEMQRRGYAPWITDDEASDRA